jgi:hypothetical protein
VSCKSNQSVSAYSQESESVNTKLAFINIKVSVDSINNEKFELIDMLYSEGGLRENNYSKSDYLEGLIFMFLDRDYQFLSKTTISHPLRTPVEVFSEDGTIEKVMPTLNEAMISFRVMLPSSAKFLQIKNQSEEVLCLISLK